MLNAEILQRFPVGTRFVSRDDPARRVRVVEGYHAAPSTRSVGTPDDEALLVHERAGYWPSLCDSPPDLFAMLTEGPSRRQPPSPEVTQAVLTQAVLAARPLPPEAGDRWNELQARIANEAEQERLAREAAIVQRVRAQEEAAAATREHRRREELARSVERTRRFEQDREAARVGAAHIESQSEHLRGLANSLQQLLAEAAQLLNKLNDRLAPPEKPANNTHADVEHEERRLLINDEDSST